MCNRCVWDELSLTKSLKAPRISLQFQSTVHILILYTFILISTFYRRTNSSTNLDHTNVSDILIAYTLIDFQLCA